MSGEYRIPGPTGGHRSTLIRTPGPTGKNDMGDPSIASVVLSEGKETWECVKLVREWWERIESYLDPDKSVGQSIKDSLELPLIFLKAVGMDAEATIPGVKLMRAEIEYLAQFIEACSAAEKKISTSREEWAKATEIANNVRPRAEDLLAKFQPPSNDRVVWKWDGIFGAFHNSWHRPSSPGLMVGPYGAFRYSSFGELRGIIHQCKFHVDRIAGYLGMEYLLLTLQVGQLKRLQLASEKAVDSMVESKNPIFQILGSLEGIRNVQERYEQPGTGASDPTHYVEQIFQEVRALASAWIEAARRVHHPTFVLQ